ncbi:RidA family protein [Rhodococcus opacus]|uniref:RidA family protein n=1 Tax=Rhodococcus opacus TaxID=37919 RepID=UPI00155A7872|nr:RidA family protein [Rhodococcus opacus]
MSGHAERRAIDIDGFGHRNPIPAASRIGPIIFSSMVVGYDAGTTSVPDSAKAQVANLFEHAGAILAAAGATWNDVVRMTFYTPDPAARADINLLWTATFSDPVRRPARVTHEVASDLGIRCEFIAYIAHENGDYTC